MDDLSCCKLESIQLSLNSAFLRRRKKGEPSFINSNKRDSDLALVKMSPAPWYKERLSSKCFREYSCKKERYSDALNTQRWQFLKSGLDDFRSGCPLPSENIIIHGKKGPVPVILHYKKPDTSQTVPYKTWELHSKRDTSFSKLSASQKNKRDYIAQTERCLAEHPLVLYPHLEESVSQELFCDIVRLLDSEMHQNRSSLNRLKSKETLPTLQYQVEDEIKTEMRHCSTAQFWKPKTRNPYVWLREKEPTAREEASRIGQVTPLDETIKQITKEFCDWVNALGGDKYNIDEATIMKLFDTRYETKAATSTPIKIVELYHVPAELKQCVGRPPSQAAYRSPAKTLSEPKLEKIRYGAWYLHPKTWKKQAVNEKPAVPDILQKFLNSRKYGKKGEEDKEAAKPLYGTYAFEEFLELKGYRKPADKGDSSAQSVGSQKRKSKTPKKKKKKKTAKKKKKVTLKENLSSVESRKKLVEDKIREFKTVWFPYVHFGENDSQHSHHK